MGFDRRNEKAIVLVLGLALLLGAALGVPLGIRISGREGASEGGQPPEGRLVRQSRTIDDEEAVIQAVDRVGASVVKIAVTQSGYLDGLFGRVPSAQEGLGSGVIIDASGLVLTNHHVIEGADQIRVALPDGRQFRRETRRVVPRIGPRCVADSRGRLAPGGAGPGSDAPSRSTRHRHR